MNEPDPNELLEFLKADSPSAAPWPAALEKDLVASKLRLCLTYGLGAVLGYILSLALCAQCSVGLSPFAWETASWIHTMPDPWCPILCGFIFGLAPALVTLLLLSRFQHRFLIFRMGWLPLLVPLLSSLLLLLAGDPHDASWRAIWFLTALGTPYLLELLAALALRQAKWCRSSDEIRPIHQ